MKVFAAILALGLVIGSASAGTFNTPSSRSDQAHRHRHLARHQHDHLLERAALPEAGFGLNKDKPIRGVNLGNWLITESWMDPAFYLNAQKGTEELRDEKKWILAHANRTEAYNTLRDHYSTYLTEADFSLMAQYGLNAVRIPVPYWTLEDAPSSDTEVFLFKGGRPQMRQVLLWCKKYNIDVMLDLHACPGSVNNYDNSGTRAGPYWQTQQSYRNRTLAVLQRMVDYYVNNPDNGGIVKGIIVMNEPLVADDKIPLDLLQSFYIKAYQAIRARVSGAKGAQSYPTIYFSNSIIGTDPWLPWFQARYNDGTFIKGTVGMDVHRYQSFSPYDKLSFDEHISRTCSQANGLRKVQAVLPVVIGEMSDGIALRCVDYRTCAGKTMQDDIKTLNTKSQNYFARRFWEAQRVTYETSSAGWFYWSWKTVSAEAWSYRDSTKQGWLPSNPSERVFVPNATEVQQGLCVSREPNRAITFRSTSTS